MNKSFFKSKKFVFLCIALAVITYVLMWYDAAAEIFEILENTVSTPAETDLGKLVQFVGVFAGVGLIIYIVVALPLGLALLVLIIFLIYKLIKYIKKKRGRTE